MIGITRLNARGQNKIGEAVVEYLMATEYYLDKDGNAQETMRWGGAMAAELGLVGKNVDREYMLKLAGGYHPISGEALCRNAGAAPRETVKRDRKTGEVILDDNGKPITLIEGGHRVGFDFTHSAPEPVSVAYAIADAEEKERILNAHRRAVQTSMDYLESKAETRRGAGGKDVIGIRGLIYSQHDHLANRDLKCNLHTHVLVYGVAQGDDYKWGTFDTVEMYRHRFAADQIYRNELALNMKELGYQIERDRELNAVKEETGRMWWSIAGISQELCDHFSTRRQQILAYMQENGGTAQQACLATRRHKDEPAYSELIDMWSKSLAAVKEGGMEVLTTEQIKASAKREHADSQVRGDGYLLERLHENEAVFSEPELIAKIGMENSGILRFSELQQEIESFKSRNTLIEINPEKIHPDDRGNTLSRKHTETRWAAVFMVEQEQEIITKSRARQHEQHVRVPLSVVEDTITDYQKAKGFQLSGEQKNALIHLTVNSGGVGVLSGFAGTGKTTISDMYSEAYRRQGFRMLGVAISNAAAQKLEEESDMPSMSAAKTLYRLGTSGKERITLTPKDVLVIDEAGMLPTDQTRALLAYAHKAGAKVILQGDSEQLQPVGAGAAFSLAKEAVGDAKLTEIRRQAHAEDRHLAGMFYQKNNLGQFMETKKDSQSIQVMREKGATILAALDARGCIDEYNTQPQAIKGLVNDYLRSSLSAREKLALAHSRQEVALLNAAIRAGLREQGKLGDTEHKLKGIDQGKELDVALSKGDLIRFTLGNADLGVVNGTQAIVNRMKKDKQGNLLIEAFVQSDLKKMDGKKVVFNTKDFPHIANAFATTIHKAQGQGKAEIFHLANTAMLDNQSALVAFTRLTKGSYTLYGTSDDMEALKDRLGLERLKGTALGEGLVGAKEAPQTAAPLSRADRLDQALKAAFDQLSQEWKDKKNGVVRKDPAKYFEAEEKALAEVLAQRRAKQQQQAAMQKPFTLTR